jgi:hypothetical protein
LLGSSPKGDWPAVFKKVLEVTESKQTLFIQRRLRHHEDNIRLSKGKSFKRLHNHCSVHHYQYYCLHHRHCHSHCWHRIQLIFMLPSSPTVYAPLMYMECADMIAMQAMSLMYSAGLPLSSDANIDVVHIIFTALL